MPTSAIYLVMIATAGVGLLVAVVAVVHALTRIRAEREEAHRPTPSHVGV